METYTIVAYGAAIKFTSAENCSGVINGFDRFPRFGLGSRIPATGFFTSKPYWTAEPMMLDNTSRILSHDSSDFSLGLFGKVLRYRSTVNPVISRKHNPPNWGF